jgi:hypothetical protein
MSCNSDTPNVNKTFIIEPLSLTGGNPTLSACTTLFSNFIESCSGDTTISMGTGLVTFNSNVNGINSFTANTIEANTYLSGGTNILDIVNANDTFTTGATLTNGILNIRINDGVNIPITGFNKTFTGNTSGSCIEDFHVSNIYSCSPLNINPNDEGNVYFGSTGITIDLTSGRSPRLGIGTSTPSRRLDVVEGDYNFYTDLNSPDGPTAVLKSNNTNRLINYEANDSSSSIAIGLVGSSWSGTQVYGVQSDSYIKSTSSNGLNIINFPNANNNHISFYAGTTRLLSTSDLYINGSGSTRGYVGIGTDTPTERLHINGSLLVNPSDSGYTSGTTFHLTEDSFNLRVASPEDPTYSKVKVGLYSGYTGVSDTSFTTFFTARESGAKVVLGSEIGGDTIIAGLNSIEMTTNDFTLTSGLGGVVNIGYYGLSSFFDSSTINIGNNTSNTDLNIVVNSTNITGDTNMFSTLTLPPGTSSKASLILQSGGTYLTSTKVGAFEFVGSTLYFTDASNTRRNVLLGSSGATATTLNSLSDTSVGTAIEGNTIYYDATTGFWRNTNIIDVDDVNSIVTVNNNLTAQSISGDTIYSGSTNLIDIFLEQTNFNSYSSNTNTIITNNQNSFISHSANTSNPHNTTLSNLVSSAHTHPISEIINLQTELDSKFDKTGGTVNGNVVITGNVDILGTATTIHTSTLSVKDNIITLSSNATGSTAPTVIDSGIEILRNSGITASLLWEESNNYWSAGLSGSTSKILLSGDSLSLLNSGHTHPISEITNLQIELNAKALDSSFDSHTGNTSNPHGTTLSNLVSSAHTHSISEIVNLETSLDSKLDTSIFNVYSGSVNTQLDSKLDTSVFNIYSGNTQNQLDSKIEDGINSGGANEIFSGKSGNTLVLRTISGGTDITVSTVGDIIKIDADVNSDSLTTTNASQAIISTLTDVPDNNTRFIESYVTAHNNSNNYGFWKRTIAVNKNSGSLDIVLETADFDSQSSGLTSTSVVYSGNSGNLIILVTGEGSKNYNWTSKWNII